MNFELRIKNNDRKRRGFTLIEVLISLAIIALIIGVSYASFISLNKTQVLEKDTEAIMALLKEAQSNTNSSVDSSSYGVYFETGENKVVSFKGEIYDENDPQNEEFVLSNKVFISDVNLITGGGSVIFNRPKGDTDDSGEVTLSLVDNSKSERIIIYLTGALEIDP